LSVHTETCAKFCCVNKGWTLKCPVGTKWGIVLPQRYIACERTDSANDFLANSMPIRRNLDKAINESDGTHEFNQAPA